MPSGSFAICTAPRPKRICGIQTFFVPFHANHDGTHDHHWNPVRSRPGNTTADSPAMMAAPERRTPHSTTEASHTMPTEVVNAPLLAEPRTETSRKPPSPARPAEMAKTHNLMAGIETPDAAAAGSDARTANAARPVRELLRLRMATLTSAMTRTSSTDIFFGSDRPKGTSMVHPRELLSRVGHRYRS